MASAAAAVAAKRPPLWTIGGASSIGTAFAFYGTQTYAIAAALAATSVTGPLGGIVFGHFGDPEGRKTALIATLPPMGLATFAIGCGVGVSGATESAEAGSSPRVETT